MKRSDKQFEEIACQVCGKPPGLSGDMCHITYGKRNSLCQKSEHCRVDEKTSPQCEYVLSSTKENIFLRACPGSGKTEVVGLKAAYEISKWASFSSGIAVLTFTNNAADVIRERVIQFTRVDRISYPHYVGTIDSWLHGYLANPFAHIFTEYTGKNGDHSVRVVEEKESGKWLEAFQCKNWYYFYREKKDKTRYVAGIPLYANGIQARPELNTFTFLQPFSRNSKYITDEEYKCSPALEEERSNKGWGKLSLKYIRDRFTETKERFWRSGFATYQDIEYICYRMLSENHNLLNQVSARFPLLIVDECQDLSETQLLILQLLINAGSTVHLVGDLHQAIYAFRKVDPRKVQEFANDNKFRQLELSQNFRSYQPIANLCSKLVGAEHIKITGHKYNKREPACIYFTYQKDRMADLVGHFHTYVQNRKLSVEESAILARGHSTVSKLRPGESSKELSEIEKAVLAVHLWQAQRIDSMDEALQCMGSLLTAAIFAESHKGRHHHYCPQSISSSLRWRLFTSLVLDECLQNEKILDLSIKQSEWAKEFSTQCQEVIRDNWSLYFDDVFTSHEFNIKAAVKDGAKAVESLLNTTHKNADKLFRITTIHDVKGETLDAVLLVSSTSKGQGGHWREWVDATRDDGEHSRFAFVGSSRAKYLLAWAIPSPSPEDSRYIEEVLGFTPISDDTLQQLHYLDALKN